MPSSSRLEARAPPTFSLPLHTTEINCLPDRIAVMLHQERTTYKCEDYMNRRRNRNHARREGRNDRHTTKNKNDKELRLQVRPCATTDENVVEPDEVCRERMIEWSYKVIDHYHANREIVSVAASCLDRFVDRLRTCDRTSFKMASMACLHIAGKLMSSATASFTTHYDGDFGGGYEGGEVPLSLLAQLSRGEFDVQLLAEMEAIVLQTLDWRVHPPTAVAFVQHLCGLFFYASSDDDSDRSVIAAFANDVCRQALFFAELSTLDYFFATQPPSLVALASVLNTVDQVAGTSSFDFSSGSLHEMLQRGVKRMCEIVVDPNDPTRRDDDVLLMVLRKKLWELHERKARVESGVSSPTVSTSTSVESNNNKEGRRLRSKGHRRQASPTSVMAAVEDGRQEYC